jgi:hypothetical protein
MRVTGKGFRITENSSKSKHSLGYVEMKIWNTKSCADYIRAQLGL